MNNARLTKLEKMAQRAQSVLEVPVSDEIYNRALDTLCEALAEQIGEPVQLAELKQAIMDLSQTKGAA